MLAGTPRNSPVVILQKRGARFQPCAAEAEKSQCHGIPCESSPIHPPQTHANMLRPLHGFSAALLVSGSISSSPNRRLFPKPGPCGASGSQRVLCAITSDQPQSIMSAPSLGFPVIRQAAAQALQRRHCFFLCLLVSNGNCTTESQYVWNLAWGCFGYIEVFASALPDLNGDFTSTELKRRKGEEGGSVASGSERGRGPEHYIITWTGIKWEGYDSLGLVKLWLKFYIHSFQGSHVLHLSREFRLSDVHEVCF